MSRAYRIRVRESVSRVIKGHDRVSTQLEVLNILPREEMAGLLAREMEKRGFDQQQGKLVREREGVKVTVDSADGTVTVEASESEAVTIKDQMEDSAIDRDGKHAKVVREQLRDRLKRNLQAKTDAQETELQKKVTDRLEAQLGDLRRELDQAVNQATAEALKKKAAQMGQIREISEDRQSGSLTIVVEV